MTPLFRPEDRVLSPAAAPSADRVWAFSALPGIPSGEPWPRMAVREHRRSLEVSGACWRVAESLPVHEDIKTGRGDFLRATAYYRMSLRRLASVGVRTVIYDFTPFSDGSAGPRINPAHLSAFELQVLRRPGAEADYTTEQIERGVAWWRGLSDSARARFTSGVLDRFSCGEPDFSLDDFRVRIERHREIGAAGLAANLRRFLEAVILTAAGLGMGLALRPDDPGQPTFGLSRAVSTVGRIDSIFAAVDLPANGLCFCAASLGAWPGADLPALARRFAPRIHAVRLEGAPSPALLRVLRDEQDRRRTEGRADWQLPMRSDHRHEMRDADTLARASA